jgi:hypothetical protein
VAGNTVVAHLVPERTQGAPDHRRGDGRLSKRSDEISAVCGIKPCEQRTCAADATPA